MSNQYIFTIPSRIHLTLISMGVSRYRAFGGIGFAINGFDLVFGVSAASNTTITDNRDNGLHSVKLNSYVDLIEKFRKELRFPLGLNVEILQGPSPHTGFGTGTSTTLCLLEALHLINSSDVDPEALTLVSGRGGASGIGINTYFSGGFVLELGRKSDGIDLLPSSCHKNISSLPLVLRKQEMPEWGMALCIPKNIPTYCDGREKEFFDSICPIDDTDVNDTLSHSILGCAASIIDGDYLTFCKSVNNIQMCAWKRKERELHGDPLVLIENTLRRHADASALSSMGPGLIIFSENIDRVIEAISIELNGCCEIVKVGPNNTGRLIRAI